MSKSDQSFAPHGWPSEWLRARLGYEPLDISLFEAALTHRSASGRNNERLEFLGDAVINLLVAESLFRSFPEASEGDLSRLRSRVVSAEPLAAVAQRLGVGEVLELGSGEMKTGGFRRQSILADAFEAVVGAIYLDRGLEAARSIAQAALAAHLDALPGDASELKDPKTRLQEILQARGLALPCYTVDVVAGDAHDQSFTVTCEVRDLAQSGSGTGSSRRRAEQDAAQRVLEQIAGSSS